MPNRLAGELSPYLLQHAENPVDWYPWGPEALKRAKTEEKPIFLSIGYSACHWCHVMEHESFENERIAAVMNEEFISIKVDREERTDLDQIYMNAVQMMTGRGGWPMSVFLTPDLEPFYGGTYWPDSSRMGMPGFDQVLRAVADTWKNRREEALRQGNEVTKRLRELTAPSSPSASSEALSAQSVIAAAAQLERIFDHRYGGFGGAPKFPHPMDLRLLLRVWNRDRRDGVMAMVTSTLDRMAAGGIYDQLGGGFHRYSVDERWLVPHFEKMLYDNALLAGCYIEAYQATAREDYATVARETLDYVLREMTAPEGGFYSTQDADTEGEEGKTYVWTPSEVEDVLGAERATTFCYVYDVSDAGNFEGKNILNRPKTIAQCAELHRQDPAVLAAALAEDRQKLLDVRRDRTQPDLDDKVLVSWNGLMIDSMALAAGVLREPRYLEAATRAADFILDTLRRDDKRLLHSWRDGVARFDAYLDDYACLANALVTLYENGFEERFIDEAVKLAEIMLAEFADHEGGGFYYTALDHEELIARNKDLLDGSVPSGNSMATAALLRLGKLCGRADFLAAAESSLQASSALMERSATAMGQMLLALDMYVGPTREIAVLGGVDDPDTREVLDNFHGRFLPNKVVACRVGDGSKKNGSSALEGLFAGKKMISPGPTLYVCENFACAEPVNGRDAILAEWERMSGR